MRNKVLTFILLLLPLGLWGAVCDTTKYTIIKSDGFEIQGAVIRKANRETYKRDTLIVLVPSPAIEKWKAYACFVDGLVEKGYSLFVYDNTRGDLTQPYELGKGSMFGPLMQRYSLHDIASDASAIYHFLRSQKQYRKSKIGFMGHSEGGISALVASCQVNPDFLIQLSSPGVSGANHAYTQNAFLTPGKLEILKTSLGLSEKELSRLEHNALEKIVQDSLDYETYEEYVLEKSGLVKADRHKQDMAKWYVRILWGNRNSHDMAMLKYNPLEYYQKLRCPVLAIFCKNDELCYALRDMSSFEKMMFKEEKKFYSALVNSTHSLLRYPDYSLLHTTRSFKHGKNNTLDVEKTKQVTNIISAWIRKKNE